MRPFRLIERTKTAEGGELFLYEQGDDFMIYLDGEELMSSRVHASEEALAAEACAAVADRPRPHVVVGGLGLGYTLRAALDALPKQAIVTVAELHETVIDWNRKYLGHLAGHPLEDPRLRVAQCDVWDVLATPDAFDAVLLDVDNGPEAWCLDANGRLYEKRGLVRVEEALTEGGMLGVWSAFGDTRFVKTLRRAGFDARAVTARAREGGRGARHTLFFATKR